MKVNEQLIRQLSTLISQRGIDQLVLKTPEVTLRLERDALRTISHAPHSSTHRSARAAAMPAMETGNRYELTAPLPGIYLDRHPLSNQPLVRPGVSISAGQLIGFLQVGCLLVPLRSAQAGRIASLPQRPGDTLGYGSVVMYLATNKGS